MQMLENLLESASGKALISRLQAEARSTLDDQRRQLGARLAEIDQRVNQELGELQPKLTEAEARLKKIQDDMTQRLTAAKNHFQALDRQRQRIGEEAERARQGIFRELETTCPPEIGALIDDLEKAIAAMGRQSVIEETRETGKAHHLGGKIKALFSNRPAVASRVQTLLAARARAFALRSQFVPDLAGEIEEIRATLPAGDLAAVQVVELED
jgi:chromosome segregation ATPase